MPKNKIVIAGKNQCAVDVHKYLKRKNMSISIKKVLKELAKRKDVSGLKEKENRGSKKW